MGVPREKRVGLSVTSPRALDFHRGRCELSTSIPNAKPKYTLIIKKNMGHFFKHHKILLNRKIVSSS